MDGKSNFEGFIQILILIAIIIGAGIIGGGSYFGYIQFKNYQTGQVEKEKMAQEAQQQRLDELSQQITDLKNKPPEIKTETKTIIVESKDTTAAIVAEWQSRVARVQCNWAYANDKVYQTNQASGVLVNLTGIGTSLVTNKHVVMDENRGYAASWCTIGIYDKGARIVGSVLGKTPFVLGNNQDWAYIKLGSEYSSLDNPPNTDAGYFDEVTLKRLNVCMGQVNNGDKLIILGYPTIGTQGGITVTEGIVSGIEGDYYVTSAKIDHGNSGGAAILIKDDCYLGIPTSAAVGGIESLGRILKASFVIGIPITPNLTLCATGAGNICEGYGRVFCATIGWNAPAANAECLSGYCNYSFHNTFQQTSNCGSGNYCWCDQTTSAPSCNVGTSCTSSGYLP